MAYYELPKAWRPDVGNECETGIKIWEEWCVDVEYIENYLNNVNKQYYMRWCEWFETKEEAYDFIKNFKHGEIRQAWITKVVTTKTREKYFDSPHNIMPGNKI